MGFHPDKQHWKCGNLKMHLLYTTYERHCGTVHHLPGVDLLPHQQQVSLGAAHAVTPQLLTVCHGAPAQENVKSVCRSVIGDLKNSQVNCYNSRTYCIWQKMLSPLTPETTESVFSMQADILHIFNCISQLRKVLSC